MPPPPAALKKKASKNVPILSQEYFIQNHGKYFGNNYDSIVIRTLFR